MPAAKTTGKKPRRDTKWRDEFYVRVYRLARDGVSDAEIARVLGISRELFYRWRKCKPAFADALARGGEDRGDAGDFAGWVYERLSPELRAVWDRIALLEGPGGGGPDEAGVAQIEAVLADGGTRARQELFLYALCVSGFNPSAALKKVRVPKRTLDAWLLDPGFADLVGEIQWHKKNYFEGALVALVKEGDTSATVFVNKTLNSDRGYGPRSDVNVSVSGQILHGVLDLAELLPRMSAACRDEVMELLRGREAAALPAPVAPAAFDLIAEEIARNAEPEGPP